MIKLPAFFSNGMVISKNAKVWGWASPGQVIPAEFLGKSYEAVADETGRFEFTFLSEKYGQELTLTIGDIVIHDVCIGRVWLCGGQSNMEGPLSRTRVHFNKYTFGHHRIRYFQVEKGLNFDSPTQDVNGAWNDPNDIWDDMYAVPYYFALTLIDELPPVRQFDGDLDSRGDYLDHVTIGLLCNPAGGTPIEGWLPEEIIQDYPDLYKDLLEVKEPGFIEKSTKEAQSAVDEWHSLLHARDVGILEGWHLRDYDDSEWESRMLLDSTDLPEYGSVWFRKDIGIPADPRPNSTATLRFGRVENSVRIYVNGKEVVTVSYKYPPCTCIIPSSLLVKGKNTIAVQIIGEDGRPTITPDKEYSLTLDYLCVVIDLNNAWKRRVAAVMPKCQPGPWFYRRPCGVYNHMLAPLLGYFADGLIWYQGESNTENPKVYKELFTIFADLIRKHHGQDLPIIFTQLANYIDPGYYIGESGVPGENWAQLREQQRKCLEIPNTAMAVTIDCGEWNDLHPVDKKTVGHRLALHALRMVYNKNIANDGPIVSQVITDNGVLTVQFENALGMWAKGGHPMLDVIDEDGKVHRIYAVVNGNTLRADIGSIKPTLVRFGWVDCPSVVLYNAHGLPASPFEVRLQQG